MSQNSKRKLEQTLFLPELILTQLDMEGRDAMMPPPPPKIKIFLTTVLKRL